MASNYREMSILFNFDTLDERQNRKVNSGEKYILMDECPTLRLFIPHSITETADIHGLNLMGALNKSPMAGQA